MMLLYVNLTNSGLLPALGWPRQGAVRCRRQSLLLYFLLAFLTFFATVRFCPAVMAGETEGEGDR